MSETLQRDTLIGDYGHVEPAVFAGLLSTRTGKISQLHEDPELIMRREPMIPLSYTPEKHAEILQANLHNNAQAIQLLHDEYGICSPNYIVVGPVAPGKSMDFYTATSRIHGTYFATEHLEGSAHPGYQLDKIPEAVTEKTFGNILRYFEDVLEGKVDHYAADLRLGNLIYGRQTGDYKDEVYFFDLENLHFMNIQEGYWVLSQIIRNPDRFATSDLNRDLLNMKSAYGKDFSDLEARLDKLYEGAEAKRAGIGIT